MAKTNKNSKMTVRTEVRRLQAYDLRIAGLSYQKIGDQLGISDVAAWQYVDERLTEIREESAEKLEQIKQMEIDRLDRLFETTFKLAEEGSARHVETCLKILERRSRLLGLDAPKQVEHNGEIQFSIEDWRKSRAKRLKEVNENIVQIESSNESSDTSNEIVEGEIL